ncbi:MAG: hypothetical protein AUH40_03580 [Chloroflexi bacterium 13_1_40CM_65_17]|nr:MAG: hypothetical protein AUH40_03580 [Chloroflexi bacterium 13_1_40CM_65_17]
MTFVYSLDDKHDLPPDELVALIGGKAANLNLMASGLELPVPPGFAITTEACRVYLAAGWPSGLDGELAAAMRRLEASAGRRFGDPHNPLLVSVRSGAPVSMPGMMDTILNVGLSGATTRGLAAVSGDAAFAADCRRRLEEMFTKTVGAAAVPDDPRQQLREAIEAVFASWNSDRARAYRNHEGIADDLGTAVTVQAMVFGNWGADSATGVLFTRNPATGEPALYGDVLFASQGEDVVAGTHRTQPLGVLDERLPAAGRELRRHAHTLERHFVDLCDVEFTIEQGKLWLLQVRVGKRSAQAALRIAVDMAEDVDFPLTRAEAVKRVGSFLAHPPMISTGHTREVAPLAVGLPASPGVATGEIATSPSEAVIAAEAGHPVILVRAETSPDDIQGMAKAVGVLTSRGGLASHAAVVARGWGIPAVVGVETMKVGERIVDVDGHKLNTGDTITIDGGTGEVFAGVIAGSTAIAPEATILLAWARELRIKLEDSPPPGRGEGQGEGLGQATEEDVLRALVIKGSATLESLADAVLTTSDKVRSVVERLINAGLVESTPDGVRLTGSGKRTGASQLAADRNRWGGDHANAALESFGALDLKVKEAVTAWQLREVDGAQVLNDHADAAYDDEVLDGLASLHGDAAAWLSSLRDPPPALRRYLTRLERALELARNGDERFIASPRVDSYHGVWFELHEDLIQLAGRSRA